MTVPNQENQPEQNQLSNKELNFRALEQRYQQQLAQERAERERLAKELEQRQSKVVDDEDEDMSDPYVDHKRLKKEQARFSQQIKQETQSQIQQAIKQALDKENQDRWLKKNADFNDVMKFAEQFAELEPEMTQTILEMPEGFERQKLAYQVIKSKGLHKPQAAKESIQQRIDANQRGPYYQPANMGNAPHAPVGDFSRAGQAAAYEKLKSLKAKYGM